MPLPSRTFRESRLVLSLCSSGNLLFSLGENEDDVMKITPDLGAFYTEDDEMSIFYFLLPALKINNQLRSCATGMTRHAKVAACSISLNTLQCRLSRAAALGKSINAIITY